MSTTTSIILDTRRIKKTGKFPLKLRVIHDRIPKDYSTIFELSESNHIKLSGARVNAELQTLREKSSEIIVGANNAIKKMEVFDFATFKTEYIDAHPWYFKMKRQKTVIKHKFETSNGFDFTPYQKRFRIFDEDHSNHKSISATFLVYIKLLLEKGSVGSAINYQRSYYSIKTFKGNVTFYDVTVSFLRQYQNWMLNKGNTKTTVGIVLRSLRSIFNQAIDNGIIKR